MQPLFYVMAIMGCGDGSAECQQARVESVHYQSLAQCQMAMPAALQRNSDVDYPVVQAACRGQGALMTRAETSNRRAG